MLTIDLRKPQQQGTYVDGLREWNSARKDYPTALIYRFPVYLPEHSVTFVTTTRDIILFIASIPREKVELLALCLLDAAASKDFDGAVEIIGLHDKYDLIAGQMASVTEPSFMLSAARR